MPATIPGDRELQARRGEELYCSDGYSWAMQQADALRRRDLDAVDWENVIEEIEAVGRRERNGWESLCARALEHMLAIEHWPAATESALRHWIREIDSFRLRMASVLDRNPGLQGRYDEMYSSAWRDARRLAVYRLADYEDPERPKECVRKWDRRSLPQACPYRREHVAAYEPRRDSVPDLNLWPPRVAKVLNERLGRNYPILPEREFGRAR